MNIIRIANADFINEKIDNSNFFVCKYLAFQSETNLLDFIYKVLNAIDTIFMILFFSVPTTYFHSMV